MESTGIRAMLAPTLPRISSREPAPDHLEDAPGRRIQTREAEARSRRIPTFKEQTAPPGRIESGQASGPSRLRAGVTLPEKTTTVSPGRGSTPAAMLHKITEAVRLQAGSGTRIRIAVDEFVIELSLQGSVLQGKVLARNQVDRDLIVSQLHILREALESRGIRLGEFQVTVEGREPARPARGPGLDLLA